MSIIRRLSQITELPTLPEVMLKVQALVDSDDGDAKELARVIREDPALAAKILKVANSAFFSAPAHRVSSIELAVTRIGFNEVRNIVVAVSLVRQFTRKSKVLDYRAFWQHALSAAYLTQRVALLAPTSLPRDARDQIFLSGLLHDIGILIYDQFFHQEFQEIIDIAQARETSFLEAEASRSSSESHSLVGAALLELWRLSPSVTMAVRSHHDLARVPESARPHVAAVHLVEYVLCSWSLGSFEGAMSPSQEALDTLGLTQQTLPRLYEEAEQQLEKTEAILSASAGNANTALPFV